MPREIITRTTVYTFAELSDAAKKKALEHLYDVNVDYDWWGNTYDDAKQIGCKIDRFDLGRGNYCGLTCKDACRTARLILADHGPDCETYKLAAQYMKDHAKIMEEANRDGEEILYDDDALTDLDDAFERALAEEYLSILQQEYDYLTSEEAIVETIEANEYKFTEDGRVFHA